jgi:hypothetical protein
MMDLILCAICWLEDKWGVKVVGIWKITWHDRFDEVGSARSRGETVVGAVGAAGVWK